MTKHDDGVIDLIQLLKDILEVRESAMSVAIDKRDTNLAWAVANGIDSEVHRLIADYAASARDEADQAFSEATAPFRNSENTAIIMVGNAEQAREALDLLDKMQESNRLASYAHALIELNELAMTIVPRTKGVHPMLFERTTIELIELLAAEEEKQRERERQAEVAASN